MTKYKIKLYSKKKESIDSFLKLIKQTKLKLKNLQILTNITKQTKKVTRITILKSPHVNKKAQEHFQFVTYEGVATFFSWDTKKNTIFFKRIKNNTLPELKIKIEKTKINSRKNQKKETFLKLKKLMSSKIAFFYIKQQNKTYLFKACKQNQKIFNKTVSYLKNLDINGSLFK